MSKIKKAISIIFKDNKDLLLVFTTVFMICIPIMIEIGDAAKYKNTFSLIACISFLVFLISYTLSTAFVSVKNNIYSQDTMRLILILPSTLISLPLLSLIPINVDFDDLTSYPLFITWSSFVPIIYFFSISYIGLIVRKEDEFHLTFFDFLYLNLTRLFFAYLIVLIIFIPLAIISIPLFIIGLVIGFFLLFLIPIMSIRVLVNYNLAFFKFKNIILNYLNPVMLTIILPMGFLSLLSCFNIINLVAINKVVYNLIDVFIITLFILNLREEKKSISSVIKNIANVIAIIIVSNMILAKDYTYTANYFISKQISSTVLLLWLNLFFLYKIIKNNISVIFVRLKITPIRHLFNAGYFIKFIFLSRKDRTTDMAIWLFLLTSTIMSAPIFHIAFQSRIEVAHENKDHFNNHSDISSPIIATAFKNHDFSQPYEKPFTLLIPSETVPYISQNIHDAINDHLINTRNDFCKLPKYLRMEEKFSIDYQFSPCYLFPLDLYPEFKDNIAMVIITTDNGLFSFFEILRINTKTLKIEEEKNNLLTNNCDSNLLSLAFKDIYKSTPKITNAITQLFNEFIKVNHVPIDNLMIDDLEYIIESDNLTCDHFGIKNEQN